VESAAEERDRLKLEAFEQREEMLRGATEWDWAARPCIRGEALAHQVPHSVYVKLLFSKGMKPDHKIDCLSKSRQK
jgi:hypothetical protein